MGKSHFIENTLKPYVQSIGGSLEVISNDKIRKGLIDRYLQDNRHKSIEDAFEATISSTAKTFNDNLKAMLKQYIESTSSKKHVLYLDKNHPPNIITKTIETITKFTSTTSTRILKLALIPDILQPYQEYPFSLPFLV